jgi:hypothetical protein
VVAEEEEDQLMVVQVVQVDQVVAEVNLVEQAQHILAAVALAQITVQEMVALVDLVLL